MIVISDPLSQFPSKETAETRRYYARELLLSNHSTHLARQLHALVLPASQGFQFRSNIGVISGGYRLDFRNVFVRYLVLAKATNDEPDILNIRL